MEMVLVYTLYGWMDGMFRVYIDYCVWIGMNVYRVSVEYWV